MDFEDFTIKLEAIHRGEWKPVVRYNYAHGRLYEDVMNPEGVEVRKDRIPEQNLSKVVLFAQRDLLENWIKCLEELGFEEA